MILLSLGLACIAIGIILALLQISASADNTQQNAAGSNSLVHAIVLTGSFVHTSAVIQYDYCTQGRI